MDAGLRRAPSYEISRSFSRPMLRPMGSVPALRVPAFVPSPVNRHGAFARLDNSSSLRPVLRVELSFNLCLQVPGRILRVVQNSRVLMNPCSMNSDAAAMVIAEGTGTPEKVENREAPIGRMTRV